MSALRKLKAMVLVMDDIQASNEELQSAGVPISTADCRSCPDPCDHGELNYLVEFSYFFENFGSDNLSLGHEEYPARWNVDMETQMFGSVKPDRRQVRIKKFCFLNCVLTNRLERIGHHFNRKIGLAERY